MKEPQYTVALVLNLLESCFKINTLLQMKWWSLDYMLQAVLIETESDIYVTDILACVDLTRLVLIIIVIIVSGFYIV